MAKQKPKIKPIDLSKESLMKQPTAYTLMPKKATLTQMKVFTVIMYRLQAFFNKVIEEKYKTPEKSQQLFLDFAADNGEFVIAKETTRLIDPGDVLIDIPLRDLHIEPKNYPAAVETLWRVASTPCVINDEETGEQKITNFMYLVKGGNITATKEEITETDPITGKTVKREVERIRYKQPRIRMGIPRAVAAQIFDIDIRGYDQFSLPAALAAGSVYTLLIYILVSGQYHRGNNQFQKDYMELREELGFFDTPTDKNASKYIEWAQFERGVMRVAKDELDRKLKSGEIDMSFDYEPVFDRWLNPATGRTKRIVQRITFRVIPSASIAHLLTVQPTETDELIQSMMGELKLTNPQVTGKYKGFLARTRQLLGPDGIARLRTKVNELIAEKNKRTDINNVGRWACSRINEWLQKQQPSTQPTEVVSESAALTDLRERMAEPVVVATLPEGYWRLTSLDMKHLWDVMQAVKSQVSEADYHHWVEPLGAADTVDGTALIVRYHGSTYRGQKPMHSEAYRLMLTALRTTFPDRIDNIRPEFV